MTERESCDLWPPKRKLRSRQQKHKLERTQVVHPVMHRQHQVIWVRFKVWARLILRSQIVFGQVGPEAEMEQMWCSRASEQPEVQRNFGGPLIPSGLRGEKETCKSWPNNHALDGPCVASSSQEGPIKLLVWHSVAFLKMKSQCIIIQSRFVQTHAAIGMTCAWKSTANH